VRSTATTGGRDDGYDAPKPQVGNTYAEEVPAYGETDMFQASLAKKDAYGETAV